MRDCIKLAAALACAASWPSPVAAQEPPKSHPAVPIDRDVAHAVVPAMHRWTPARGDFALAATARIVVPRDASGEIRTTARQFGADLAAVSGLVLTVADGPARSGDITLTIGAMTIGNVDAAASREAYAITVANGVTLRATSHAGLVHATQSLLQLLRRSPGGRILPRGEAQDWPDYPDRALMIDVGRKFFQVAQLDATMREMAWLKLNTLGLHFTDWPAFRLDSPKYPGLAARESYSRADIAHLEATARRWGITIIPEIDLPAHASALIRYKPDLAFDCPSMRQSAWLDRSAGADAPKLAWAIDITKDANRAWMRGLLGEFMPWFSGPYFHIGGDEYQYDADKNRCPELVADAKKRGLQYPGDVFVDWINETNRFVRAHGKRTVIWNWWRFKDDKTSIQPDKNILIYAWNSPRLPDIIANGYDVMVTPEDKLYVVPGIENFDGGGYGLVDQDKAYTSMPFEQGKQVRGYMAALWADAAEHRTDAYLLSRSYEPMAIVAERTWSGRASPSLDAFYARLGSAGMAPRPDPLAR